MAVCRVHLPGKHSGKCPARIEHGLHTRACRHQCGRFRQVLSKRIPLKPADLDARTNSGSIDSAHPVTMEVTGRIDKRHIQGKVRGGGPLIEASCSSGTIRIK